MGDFKSVLKILRNSNNLTQDMLAQKLGLSRSAIGMYEKGSREPDYETLEKIADFFNVDIDYLLGRTLKTTLLPENIKQGDFNQEQSYYTNPETQKIAQEIFDNPDLKMLFDTTKDCSPEDMKKVISMVKIFKGEN